jgi:hypothetical protein
MSLILASSQAFFHPKAFLDLKALHISGFSLVQDPHIAQFLHARAPSLQSLSLERVVDKPGLLRRLPVTEKLEELHLDVSSSEQLYLDVVFYEQLFSTASSQSVLPSPIFRRYAHLRCLDVRGITNYGEDVFRLMVEIARGGCRIEALNLTVNTILFLILRVALLLLPTVNDLTFSNVKSCDSLMCQLSRHPLWMDLDNYTLRDCRFIGLAKAGMQLGPVVRRAITAEFRKDIDRIYSGCISSLVRKDALYSSIKMALKAGQAGGKMATRHDAPAEDHRKVTLELVESCLVSGL